jgi:large subunit ribosomal protein L13
MKTSIVKLPAPSWYLVDADGKTIGFVASKVAHVLRGKHRVSFSPHQFTGDHVVIVNADKLSVPPAKLRRKIYYHHTGYPGHMKRTPLERMIVEKPEHVLEHAIKGMLPRNRLRLQMLRHLHVFRGGEHPYRAQKPSDLSLEKL